ncbi:MAG: tetratricopeptide repeat protein [Paludibacteraceae bacterium]|nr:tetratricopeptide repeat protein [Paludibacteraceae bacterium]
MKRLIYTLLAVLLLSPAVAQEEYSDIRRGNREFDKENWSAAEVNYRRALQKNPNSFAATYNLGNALLRQEKYEDAAKQYIRSTTQVDAKKDGDKLAKAYHNLGNSYFAMEQYDKAVEAYKNSLRLNPSDNETRYNLVKAMQMQKNQQQPQQQPQEQPQQQNQMEQQTAEQLLQALQQDEQEAQEKAQKRQSKKKELEKNW